MRRVACTVPGALLSHYPPSPACIVVQDEGGSLAPLANTRTVSDEEPRTLAPWQQLLVFGCCVAHPLQLQLAQAPLLHDAAGQRLPQRVGGGGQRDGAAGGGGGCMGERHRNSGLRAALHKSMQLSLLLRCPAASPPADRYTCCWYGCAALLQESHEHLVP